jgi:hypothetical protein
VVWFQLQALINNLYYPNLNAAFTQKIKNKRCDVSLLTSRRLILRHGNGIYLPRIRLTTLNVGRKKTLRRSVANNELNNWRLGERRRDSAQPEALKQPNLPCSSGHWSCMEGDIHPNIYIYIYNGKLILYFSWKFSTLKYTYLFRSFKEHFTLYSSAAFFFLNERASFPLRTEN